MHRVISKTTLFVLLTALLLGGCASQVPQLIRQPAPDSPAVAEARDRVESHVGRLVRWGGLLLATENREHSSRLTILAYPLGSDGEPRYSDDSEGRFIAIVPAFLDPAIYAEHRLVTITGTLVSSETELVGAHPYTYPVVEAKAWYLWPEPAASKRGYYPGWYDPWYGPWWYGSWYDPWYSPYWYPYRHPYTHPHPVHPKPAPPEDGPDEPEPGPPPPGDHQPGEPPHTDGPDDGPDHPPPGDQPTGERPRANGPHKSRDYAEPPFWRGPHGAEQPSPPPPPVQAPVMDSPAPGPGPVGDDDGGGGLWRIFQRN